MNIIVNLPEQVLNILIHQLKHKEIFHFGPRWIQIHPNSAKMSIFSIYYNASVQ